MQACEVVAAVAARPHVLQLPSPVYAVVWVDEVHLLIAAGGGGRRFGMANVLVLVEVMHETKNEDKGATSATTPSPLWRFIAALDLEGDVPWCASSFCAYTCHASSNDNNDDNNNDDDDDGGVAANTPATMTSVRWCAGQRTTLRGVHGFVALSSIACFLLIGVYRARDAHGAVTYTLRRLSRVALPSDVRNADKKPLALIADAAAVVVAHDDGGLHVYSLDTLVPCAAQDDGADGHASTTRSNSSRGNGDSTAAVTAAAALAPSPYAVWHVGARVNDVHACCSTLVHAKLVTPHGASACSAHDAKAHTDATPSQQCRALLLRYLVLAAALHDKTLRVGCVRLCRSTRNGDDGDDDDDNNNDACARYGGRHCRRHHRHHGRHPCCRRSCRCPCECTAHGDDVDVAATQWRTAAPVAASASSAATRPCHDDAEEEEQQQQAQCVQTRPPLCATTTRHVVAGPVLTGALCGLPFALMPSSLRLVRVYAKTTTTTASRRQQRSLVLRSLRQQGLLPHTPATDTKATAGHEAATDDRDEATAATLWASLLLVAYDVTSSRSYLVHARVTAELQGDVARDAATAAVDTTAAAATLTTRRRRYDAPRMHVRVSTPPSPLLADCVTCLASCRLPARVCADAGGARPAVAASHGNDKDAAKHGARRAQDDDDDEHDDEATLPPPPPGLLVGSVDGCVALLRRCRDAHAAYRYRVCAQRPSSTTSSSSSFLWRGSGAAATASSASALHKEPISAVAASVRGVVATADIAQHVVLTIMSPSSLQLPALFDDAATLSSWWSCRGYASLRGGGVVAWLLALLAVAVAVAVAYASHYAR